MFSSTLPEFSSVSSVEMLFYAWSDFQSFVDQFLLTFVQISTQFRISIEKFALSAIASNQI